MERLWAPWRIEYIRNVSKEKGCFLCAALKEKEKAKVFIIEKNPKAFTIMNRYPYNTGHLLIAPVRHIGEWEGLDDEEILDIHRLISRAIKAIRCTMNPDGFNMGINQGLVAGAGLVDHFHIHLVPRWKGDTNFMPVLGETKIISEALNKTYNKIIEGYRLSIDSL